MASGSGLENSECQLTSTGPYVLKSLMKDVPLSKDNSDKNIAITCVEYWEGNLYVGTTAAEVLHFVSIPDENQGEAQFILASRLEPSRSTSADLDLGVQQIVILPRTSKACILCNSTLTFHSLPELSPAVGNRKVSNCTWIGGQDLDLDNDDGEDGDVVMLSIKNKLRLVRIAEEAKPTRAIEFPGCLSAARRSRYACVADDQAYALLDVEAQQKIPLFPISSQSESSAAVRHEDNAPPVPSEHERNRSITGVLIGSGQLDSGHTRTTSLGTLVDRLSPRSGTPRSRSRERPNLAAVRPGSGAASPAPRELHSGSPRPQSPQKTLPPTPDAVAPQIGATSQVKSAHRLRPHIVSPLPSEFLLTTGTTPSDPGVGIFVNCDGDVVRGTLEFTHYPDGIVIDGGNPMKMVDPQYLGADSEGYVLAAMKQNLRYSNDPGIEIQRWDTTGEDKAWLGVADQVPDSHLGEGDKIWHVGIGLTQTAIDLSFPEIGKRLRSGQFRVHAETNNVDGTVSGGSIDAIQERNKQEDEFASRLGKARGQIIAWNKTSIHWILRNPILIKYDSLIDSILDKSTENRLDQAVLIGTLKKIRDIEAKSETEFLSLEYIRQKISIILFADLAVNRYDVNPQLNEQLLLEGGADPRVILSMVPLLSKDIFEGQQGIWIQSGLIRLMRDRLSSTAIILDSDEVLSRPEDYDILGLIKRYLTNWRQRKGFGSIADEVQVFATVDAALLHVLLYQDQQSHLGPGGSSSLRNELHSVVDGGVNCFDRAIELLEEFHRLYLLSRLYQSRKMSAKVLETWRRILDGEHDDGGEFINGENEVRRYLTNRGNTALIEEYGTWLARRNPSLGVQLFTDDNSRVKLPPQSVVQMLKTHAPDAVKVYLEHLVFGKKNVQYANELIAYYLDTVLSVLESSDEARSILSQSYETYRALEAPKPTYRQFITDNAIPASWWNDRLRLLELLGGSYGAGFSYDVAHVLERIEPFENELVPESIILEGRQGRHQQALHLLTHGLGDYHTAINYCLLGGSSIFHPSSGSREHLSIPNIDQQSLLFKYLFLEFLQIEDTENRFERTSELLGRFGSWFDITYIINEIPDSWTVDYLSKFLTGAIRQLVHERAETTITKALSGAENLKVSEAFAEKCETTAPHVTPAMDTPTSII